MDCRKRLFLFTTLSSIILYDTILITYLHCAEFDQFIIQVFGFLFFLLSFLINPIMLILFFKYTTTYSSCKFNSRLLIFIPLSTVLCNSFLALNPVIMRRLAKFIGITDPQIIGYASIILYIGKLCTTSILDLFCQGLIIGNNISASESLT